MRTRAGIFFIVVSILAVGYLYLTPKIDTFVDVGRCGIGLEACPEGKRCVNGYCKSDNPPTMPTFSDLPVLPPLVGSGQTRL
jgi:hypothetical protein